MIDVDIEITTMGFNLCVEKNGLITGTHVNIGEFVRKLSHHSYNRKINRWELINEFFRYDTTNKRCYFPKYELENFLFFLKSFNIKYRLQERPIVVGKETPFLMLPHVNYKDDLQRNTVTYLTNEESGPIRGLALQTGKGKTFSAIKAFQTLGIRSLITMTSRLEQWIASIVDFTNLENTEDDIYLIQGIGSLNKLFSNIDKEFSPKIILASTATMRLYIEYAPSYQHLPHPSFLCENLNVGIVATDEYHEHFHTNFLIGIMLNPKIFVPITATFEANDPFVKKIFNSFVPRENQFTGGDYDRYVNVTSYVFNSGNFHIKPFFYSSPKGYSQIKFEQYLLGRGKKLLDRLVDEAILPMIRIHYSSICDKGEKFLMLCATKDFCEYLQGIFRRHFTDKSVSVFYSGMPTTILEKYDMILSTPGSAGCLSGDTIVHISRNGSDNKSGSYSCTLKNAYLHFNNLANRNQYNWNQEIPTYIRSYNGTSIGLYEVGDIIYSGVKDVYKVTLANGLHIKATIDHPIMTKSGWVSVENIVGEDVMCEVNRRAISKVGRKRLRDKFISVSMNHPFAQITTKKSRGRTYFQRRIEIHRAIYESAVLNKMTLTEYCQALKDPEKVKTMEFVDTSIYDIHHIDHDHFNNDPNNLVAMERSLHKKLHAEQSKFNFNQGIPSYSKAVSIEYIGKEDTYDIHCLDSNHNFVANGIVVHNTGRDVKNLRTCFAFENTNSITRNLQFLGRLRGYPSVKNTPEFIYLSLSSIQPHMNYNDTRALLYGPRALKLVHRQIGR